MAEYTYKDVIIDPEDPRVEIGKEYFFGDSPTSLLWGVRHGWGARELIEVYKDAPSNNPFYNSSASFQCIIRKKEPEKKYVPFDLSKEEDRAKLRGAWVRIKDYPNFEHQIVSMTAEYVFLGNKEAISRHALLLSYEFVDGTPCGKLRKEEA